MPRVPASSPCPSWGFPFEAEATCVEQDMRMLSGDYTEAGNDV